MQVKVKLYRYFQTIHVLFLHSLLNFQKYKFDGKSYINITTRKKINYNFLKNNSEPFTYSLGLMFEMARILKKHNIDLTEKYLQK